MPRVAFHTQAPAVGAPTDPVMKGFLDRTNAAYDSAHNTEGFIGRINWEGEFLADPGSEAEIPNWSNTGIVTDSRTDFYAEYEFVPSTLSVWSDLESVAAFAYRGLHAEALSKRQEWFVKTEYPVYVAWWLDDGAPLPAWSEAGRRLTQLHDDGPTPEAFDFKSAFDSSNQQVKLDQPSLDQYSKSVR